MSTNYSVSLGKIIKEFSLEPVVVIDDPENILITTPEINRPGLQFVGYYEFFDDKRIQIVGKSEDSFVGELDTAEMQSVVEEFFKRRPPAVIITRGLHISDFTRGLAKKYNVPLLRTSEGTSSFTASLISYLNVQLAPRITQHGVLVEVYGEGILILGDSGVGKSETAIELVKRGHRLIADDAVEIRRVSNKSLVGTAPENIRHFIELRGIGIINVSRIFGVGAVKLTEKIDMVINLEPWDVNKVYDRMGINDNTQDILGVNVPSVTIPIQPGRNLAVIIEVAAMNNRQKQLGYNAAKDLLDRLGMVEDSPEINTEVADPF